MLLGLISGEEENTSAAPGGCVSHTENSLKKITLVNCLIIIILILVIAANINEGKLTIKVMVIEYIEILAQERSNMCPSVPNVFYCGEKGTFLLICFLLTRCAMRLSDCWAGK